MGTQGRLDNVTKTWRQGGKARLVHVNEQVREYIRKLNVQKVREKRLPCLVMRRLSVAGDTGERDDAS